MSSVFHSLRWRLQLWHGAILLVAVLAFCLTAYRLAWNSQLRHIDGSLFEAGRSLGRGLMHATRGPGETAETAPEQIAQLLRAGRIPLPAELAERFRGTEPGYSYFSLYDADGHQLLHSENFPAATRPVHAGRALEETIRTVGTRREVVSGGPPKLATILGRDITPELESMRRFGWSLGALGLGVWALGLVGGWWLAGRAIKPIAAISGTASRIAGGNLSERIDTDGTDSELDQLGHVLNETFDRLHEVLEQQKQFTADASHELRTPVTILISETQRILKRDRTPEEYREAMQTCHDTAERMRRLIEALLLLSRQDAVGRGGPREACDLAPILREVVAQLAPLAERGGLRLETDLAPATCRANPAALAILASNLVGNAIQHHHAAGGVVTVACGATPGGVAFSVRDDGPGIAAEDQPHIFRRFYRADQARTGSSGHTGLGLAIAKAIADNHGGTISVQSQTGAGTCFTVALPGQPG